jgi:hypothetical protein
VLKHRIGYKGKHYPRGSTIEVDEGDLKRFRISPVRPAHIKPIEEPNPEKKVAATRKRASRKSKSSTAQKKKKSIFSR